MYEIKGVYGARSWGVCGLARKGGKKEKGRKRRQCQPEEDGRYLAMVEIK